MYTNLDRSNFKRTVRVRVFTDFEIQTFYIPDLYGTDYDIRTNLGLSETVVLQNKDTCVT